MQLCNCSIVYAFKEMIFMLYYYINCIIYYYQLYYYYIPLSTLLHINSIIGRFKFQEIYCSLTIQLNNIISIRLSFR